MYKCEKCDKEFTTQKGMWGHQWSHGESNTPPIMCCCILTKKEIAVKKLEQYQNKLRPCLHCGKPTETPKKFCNSSCSASYNNIQRQKDGYIITEEHKRKLRESLYKYINKTNAKFRARPQYVEGAPYSKLYLRTCKKCEIKFLYRSQVKYCSECANDFGVEYRCRYKFVFNVYNYPDLFDIAYIEQVGWYLRGNEKDVNKWNTDGLSRDHKVSVTDAIINGYDPYYIKHPLNCEIMPWIENNKKKANSSMSYEELVKQVDDYDAKHKKIHPTVKKV